MWVDFTYFHYIFAAMKTQLLTNYIKNTGMSYKDVADKIGVTQQQFYWMIRNPNKLRAEQIKAIAEAVKRSPRNLFSLIINA